MSIYPWIENFVESALCAATPPAPPFKSAEWAGFAFDRNRHEDLAPEYVWMSWLDAHRAASSDSPVVAYSRVVRDEESCEVLLDPDLEALRTYWSIDDRFLFDHFVVDPNQRWIVRLDQDVTLFGGERSFVQQVCSRAGGMNLIFADMLRDFDPGQEDRAGLLAYIRGVSNGLK